ncbi:LAQU0S13e03246g1_1 [Lachancea quebecensis]|uniref:LAQU0S13e03246g1_1 n=1 Tax=Lachancea quebecensis TaxID=1654605 RepID=A0A0P1KVW3_9SACH|nr:LAQU0S13e03246g1_1 [Lachancea quebecensis]
MIIHGLLALLCACVKLSLATSGPRITLLNDGSNNSFSLHVTAFSGSADLWNIVNGSITVSSDGGANWAPVDSLGHNITSFQLDEYHPGSRAFAVDGDHGHVFQTVDQGRTWSQMKLANGSLWDDIIDINREQIHFEMSFTTNPSALEEILVTTYVCGAVPYMCTYGFLLISTDGSSLRRARGLQALGDQSSGNGCRFSGTSAGSRIICELAPSSVMATARGVRLFYSDDHGETFAPLKEFEGLEVYFSQAMGNFDIVQTVEPRKRHRLKRKHEVWLSRDGEGYERVDAATSYEPAYISSSRNPRGNLEVRVTRKILGKTAETLLVSNPSGPLLTTLVTYDPNKRAAYVLSGEGDRDAVLMSSVDAQFSYGDERKADSHSTIVFDDGGVKWSRLQLNDSNQEFGCDPTQPGNCFINVLRFPMWKPSFSSPVAVVEGEAVAINGTSRLTSGTKTFLTKDGGFSWHKILDFPASVYFVNNGKLLFAIPASRDGGFCGPMLYYSTDQGDSWSSRSLGPTSQILLINPIAKDESGMAFAVYSLILSTELQNYIVDFSEMLAGA